MNTDNRIVMFVSGDFCPFISDMNKLFEGHDADKVFGGLYKMIRDADLSVTNLECPLTLSKSKIEKLGPNLKARPEVASFLKSAGFDVVTLANNHIYDYGQQGVVDTLDMLKKHNIYYVGAGLNLEEANKTFYIEINGIKLAIVNFAENEYSCADDKHGGANPMNIIDNTYQIKDACTKVDHVLLIIHGGHELYPYPSPGMMKRYRYYAGLGVSAVITHHPHCIGGYEKYKGVPIFYSLGNFLFPSLTRSVNPLWYEGYIIQLVLTCDKSEFSIIPYEQCKEGRLAIDLINSNKILDKINKINKVINDQNQIIKNWQQYIKTNKEYYLAKISNINRYKMRILGKLGLLSRFYNKKHLHYIRQMIRCESHKEKTLSMLDDLLG